MIARTPGLIAHVIEEQTREKPMRRIDPVNHGYDGPPARSLSGQVLILNFSPRIWQELKMVSRRGLERNQFTLPSRAR